MTTAIPGRKATSHSSMLSPGTWPRELLALYSAATLDQFMEQAFALLPRLVPCDYTSALYLGAGGGFVLERDSRGRRWSGTFLRRYAELRPMISAGRGNRRVKVVASRSVLPRSDEALKRTAFYRQIMLSQGWRHSVALCFWANPPGPSPILVLLLYRYASEPDFSDDELTRLEQLYPFLAPAVTHFHDVRISNAVADAIAAALRQVHRGIVVLDWQLRVVHANLEGRRACGKWTGVQSRSAMTTHDRTPKVPPALVKVCSQLAEALQSNLRQNPDSIARRRRHVRAPGNTGLGAAVTAICHSAAMPTPSFVIEFDARTHVRTPATIKRVLERLTKSEREVALLIAEGLSNEEAAERLGKTTHAVKFLLHRIFTKLGVATRTRLALLMNGADADRSSHVDATTDRRAAGSSGGPRTPTSTPSTGKARKS